MLVNKKQALGRGFEALLPTELFDDSFDPTKNEDLKVSHLLDLSLEEIDANPDQPRKSFDDQPLIELTNSIRQHGVLQPIVVVKKGDRYQIVAGERRFRASKLAGKTKIQAIVRKLSDQNKLELSLIENLVRQDLNIIEIATSYLKLRDQFNLTLTEIGERVGGKSVGAVSNTLRLLKLPKEVIELLSRGSLTEGQAKPLIGLEADQILQLVKEIVKNNYTARQVESAVSKLKKLKIKALPKELISKDRLIQSQAVFATCFKTKIQIKPRANGSGKVEIDFKNVDDLERIEKIISQF